MSYTTFSTEANNALREPMFLGQNVNIARYDQQRHPIFEKLTERQLSFFWRPEEIDITQDRKDFMDLSESEKHIFTSNLKYQVLLDSVQGRSPNVALLPLVSIPELETWIETWSFSETIHSRSYTHIFRGIYNDPSSVFNAIVSDPEIRKRAVDVSRYYDNLILVTQLYLSQGEGTYTLDSESAIRMGTDTIQVNVREIKKRLYLCLHSINALEAVRFYVSFACTFAFSERSLMEGCGKIMRLIARDEALHLSGTQHMINLFRSGKDDPEMAEIAQELHEDAYAIFIDAARQEKDWAHQLFRDGSMIGLNEKILCDYVEYITNQRMAAVGFEAPFAARSNPIPWINSYLVSDNVQVAPQEAEISSYLVGQIDSSVEESDFENFDL
jgi:ribonucleoside-diphosphate reductase beta chain